MAKKEKSDSNLMTFSRQSFMNMSQNSQLDLFSKMVEWLDLISVSEAARMRDVTTTAIHNLINRGRLRSQTISGETFVFKSEVENFERGKPGRKSIRKSEDLPNEE